jgi:hypothetical protein
MVSQVLPLLSGTWFVSFIVHLYYKTVPRYVRNIYGIYRGDRYIFLLQKTLYHTYGGTRLAMD